MDRIELKKLLKNNNIPTYVYNLDEVGRDDERLCLRFADGKWNVYFSERGVKTTDLLFDSEVRLSLWLYQKKVKKRS